MTRRYIATWRRRLHAVRCERSTDALEKEQRLDQLATGLRQICLRVAHLRGTHIYRSPPAHDTPITVEHLPLDFGYERDLQPVALESRLRRPSGISSHWHDKHLLFSSGQSALTATLLALASAYEDSPQNLLHLGSYFETKELLDLLERAGTLTNLGSRPRENQVTNVALIEPTHLNEDGQFSVEDIIQAVTVAKVLLYDTTLSAHEFDLAAVLKEAQNSPRQPLVITFRSGLKLDQAGLELSNVGIVSLYGATSGASGSHKIAEELQRIRTLTGTGLGFEQINALSAPWFLDPEYQARYAAAIFSNNAALARSFPQNDWFSLSHPVTINRSAVAPFCVLRLNNGTSDDYKKLENLISLECRRRRLLLQEGGSFGFRGHRYEAITPTDASLPFMRIALGARRDASHQGILQLLQEFATFGSLEECLEGYRSE